MSKTRIIFFMLLGAFSLMAGSVAMPAFAVDKTTDTPKVAKSAKVDVNNATEEELEDLPGIGAVYANKIINGRPYKNEADLLNAGIPQYTIDKIKDSVKFGKVHTVKTPAQTNPKVAPNATNAKTNTGTSTSKSTDSSDVIAKVPPHKGMVWLNTHSMIYHKEGDRWYGKTKEGEFLNEQDAIKRGGHLSKED